MPKPHRQDSIKTEPCERNITDLILNAVALGVSCLQTGHFLFRAALLKVLPACVLLMIAVGLLLRVLACVLGVGTEANWACIYIYIVAVAFLHPSNCTIHGVSGRIRLHAYSV